MTDLKNNFGQASAVLKSEIAGNAYRKGVAAVNFRDIFAMRGIDTQNGGIK